MLGTDNSILQFWQPQTGQPFRQKFKIETCLNRVGQPVYVCLLYTSRPACGYPRRCIYVTMMSILNVGC